MRQVRRQLPSSCIRVRQNGLTSRAEGKDTKNEPSQAPRVAGRGRSSDVELLDLFPSAQMGMSRNIPVAQEVKVVNRENPV